MVKLFSSRPLRFRAGFSLPHPNCFGEKIRSRYLLTDCHDQVTHQPHLELIRTAPF